MIALSCADSFGCDRGPMSNAIREDFRVWAERLVGTNSGSCHQEIARRKHRRSAGDLADAIADGLRRACGGLVAADGWVSH